VRLGESVAYQSAGTVEFVLDANAAASGLSGGLTDGFYFLEVNTRLQVEHGVTETVAGIDLVAWMIRQAAGELGDLEALRPVLKGHSIQARIYAENPRLDFRPSAGILTEAAYPSDARVDTWVEAGSEVSPFYDPLIAKIIVNGKDRNGALAALGKALAETRLYGIETNLEFLRAVAAAPAFAQGRMTTRELGGFSYVSDSVDVLAPGAQTALQDYPGRVGFWNVGVPPSGPFDALSFRLGNRLLGNPESAAGLEIIVAGPTLRFNRACTAVLTGAAIKAELHAPPAPEDGNPTPGNVEVSPWEPFRIPAGGLLRLGAVSGAGMRVYLCVQDGFDAPLYMGSRSTFTLGNFGGHAGRTLRAGDVLHLPAGTGQGAAAGPIPLSSPPSLPGLPQALRPALTNTWEIGVLYGPHGAPDYFRDSDIDMFFSTAWEVHYNSNRTGVRLIGPKPAWARPDGGEAGLHPSNIHDNAYAIGAVDFTGDMPILLGPDGPSLGGFVCPATIAQAELWKMGQLKPGDTIRFMRLSLDQARELERAQERMILTLEAPAADPQALPIRGRSPGYTDPFGADRNILHHIPAREGNLEVRYRRSGDRNILVEYGPTVLDLNLRFRAHALMEHLQALQLPGVLDLTPGIRSLQIHFDGRELAMEKLLRTLIEAESALPAIDAMELKTRIVHMPLSWDDEAIHAVIRKYMQSVRADAPWCPSNIEFIRRINGLASIEDVRKTVFAADYLVMGLGDVYLGAPVATPLDPRHRLVTTKYNPARTWTVDNVVGIGGAYMCIYGMEGPGGYQLFGRTSQVWNTYRKTDAFRAGKPWLLRFFDQIRFYPVSGKDLSDFRSAFIRGQASLKIEPHVFRLKEYNRFLNDNAADIAAFREKQRQAFNEERERWQSTGRADETEAKADENLAESAAAGVEVGLPVDAHLSGSVWKILVQPGQDVDAEQPLLILESMKMEFTVTATSSGKVKSILAKEGSMVTAGQTLLYLEA
jgi:urea carboxylase